MRPAEDSGVSIATLSALLRMVEEKERLVRLLNEYIDGPGLTIVIGQEHRTPDLRAFSLIASTYADGIAPRHGRRHRADAHALLKNHRRRRRRGTGRVAGPPRQHVIRVRPWPINHDEPSLTEDSDVERMDDEGATAQATDAGARARRRNCRVAQRARRPSRSAAAPGRRVR